ncbi:MAG: signal peptide peptidase SppA [bacterium]
MIPRRITLAAVVLFSLSFTAGVYLILQSKISQIDEDTTHRISFGKSIIPDGNVAIVRVEGIISASARSSMIGREGSESIVDQLNEIGKKDHIKAIVLRINSPGGSVASAQEIYNEILKLKAKGKIIVASMSDVAASGGYYVASACDKIVANPGTITGSIGVIMEVSNIQELFKKIGVKFIAIKSGEFKDSGSPFRELTKKERELFQSLIDDAYNQFVDAIVKGRSMKRKDVLSIADGRVFTGRQAYKAGLVDELGGKEESILVAAQMAGIPSEKINIYRYRDSFKYIFRFLDSALKRVDPISQIAMDSRPKFKLQYILE